MNAKSRRGQNLLFITRKASVAVLMYMDLYQELIKEKTDNHYFLAHIFLEPLLCSLHYAPTRPSVIQGRTLNLTDTLHSLFLILSLPYFPPQLTSNHTV